MHLDIGTDSTLDFAVVVPLSRSKPIRKLEPHNEKRGSLQESNGDAPLTAQSPRSSLRIPPTPPSSFSSAHDQTRQVVVLGPVRPSTNYSPV